MYKLKDYKAHGMVVRRPRGLEYAYKFVLPKFVHMDNDAIMHGVHFFNSLAELKKAYAHPADMPQDAGVSIASEDVADVAETALVNAAIAEDVASSCAWSIVDEALKKIEVRVQGLFYSFACIYVRVNAGKGMVCQQV